MARVEKESLASDRVLSRALNTALFSPTEPRRPKRFDGLAEDPLATGVGPRLLGRSASASLSMAAVSVWRISSSGFPGADVALNAHHRRHPHGVGKLCVAHRGDHRIQGLRQRRWRLLDAVQFADHQHGVDLHGRMIGTGDQLLHEVQHQGVQMVVYFGPAANTRFRSWLPNSCRNLGSLAISFIWVHLARA